MPVKSMPAHLAMESNRMPPETGAPRAGPGAFLEGFGLRVISRLHADNASVTRGLTMIASSMTFRYHSHRQTSVP